MNCDYCQKEALLVTGETIYPHRPDLFQKKFWYCEKCDAYCGCHNGTEIPLGVLANRQLRKLRIKAHYCFDKLWKSGKMKRQDAYKWLQVKLGIPAQACHIGRFNEYLCKETIKAIGELK